MAPNTDNIVRINRLVERKVGRQMHSPSDFDFLAQAIADATKQTISTATLKRLWGYVKGYDSVRYSTLDILASYLGYANWDGFERLYCQSISSDSSDPVVAAHIRSAELHEGDLVEVCWLPDRECTFRYLGGEKFLVIEAINSKVQPGDSFCAPFFVLGEPLMVSDLTQQGFAPRMFVMGKNGGLTRLHIITSAPTVGSSVLKDEK